MCTRNYSEQYTWLFQLLAWAESMLEKVAGFTEMADFHAKFAFGMKPNQKPNAWFWLCLDFLRSK